MGTERPARGPASTGIELCDSCKRYCARDLCGILAVVQTRLVRDDRDPRRQRRSRRLQRQVRAVGASP